MDIKVSKCVYISNFPYLILLCVLVTTYVVVCSFFTGGGGGWLANSKAI